MPIEASATKADHDSDSDSDPDENRIIEAAFQNLSIAWSYSRKWDGSLSQSCCPITSITASVNP